MSDKTYSVGEIAAMTQLTIRTLQHYDVIGLLPASRNAESGRRFYTEADILRLEQIIFYKSLGFSLREIEANLMDLHNPEQIRALFVKQEYMLLRKIEQMHTSFAAIDASLQVLDIGYPPPFDVILSFIRLLPGEDVFEWAPSLLDAEQKAAMAEIFNTLEEAQSFYHTLKALLINALVLLRAQVAPSHPQAQILAKNWQGLLHTISSENPTALEQFARIGENREFELPRHPELMKEMYEYIQIAVEYYLSGANDPVVRLISQGSEFYARKNPMPTQITQEQMQRWEMPVYAAMAANSPLHDSEKALATAKANVGNVQAKNWPGATHSLPMEFSKQIDAEILRFIALNSTTP